MRYSDPEQMQTMLQSLSDLTKHMNMMVIFMNPQTYMNWKIASKDTEFNQSEFGILNAPSMAKSFEAFFKLLTAIQTDTKTNN